MTKHYDLLDRLKDDWRRERPELDPRGMGIVGRILVLAKLLEDRVEDVLLPFGIRYTDLDVLATLRRSGKPYSLRPADLLDNVLITSGSMTACIDRLREAGLVIRKDHPEDRRSRVVQLTASGKRLVDKAIIARFRESNDAIQPLDGNERKLLEQLLKKLLRELDMDGARDEPAVPSGKQSHRPNLAGRKS